MLRENARVRRALQQKYRYLFVDEFQDTDPVQAEIVFWLAEATDAASTSSKTSPADWRQVPLRPGALFVVGDPKQSIYRFRRADIDIYNIVRERFSEPAIGRGAAAHDELPVGARRCATWANTSSRRGFRRSRPCTRRGLRRSIRSRSRPFAAACSR